VLFRSERPNWFAPDGVEPKDETSFGRQNWFPHVGAEHKTVREHVGLFDQSSFAKFEMRGKDAEKALSWICANNVARPVGSIIYTQMLNKRGGIECDLTVARTAEDCYYIVTGTGYRTHNFSWISRNIPKNCDVQLVDVTDEGFVLSLMGPRSREVLQHLTDADVSNGKFPFGTCREIEIAGARVNALRITYVGELGWELHGNKKDALVVYQALMEAGKAFAITNAGYRAIESLRLEKGYRAWGSDIGPDHTPFEAGLGWAVKLKSNTPFIGREALVENLGKPLVKQLACFTVDDPEIVLLGRETILRNGERVGWLSSAGWGYTLEKNIGFGYIRHAEGVDREFILSGGYELDVATKRIPCKVHMEPLYDPAMKKVKT